MSLHLLYKLPTRSRPHKAVEAIEAIIRNSDTEDFTIMLSIDKDDEVTMQHFHLFSRYNLLVDIDQSQTKIHATNRNLNKVAPFWDVVIVMSDDMRFIQRGFDTMIRQTFIDHFPDTDGCVWFPDGKQERICTLPIIGRVYYERYKYLYHPSYISLWCDNEFTEVAQRDNKLIRRPEIIITHLHPAWNHTTQTDDLYIRNEAFFETDRVNYERRKAVEFA